MSSSNERLARLNSFAKKFARSAAGKLQMKAAISDVKAGRLLTEDQFFARLGEEGEPPDIQAAAAADLYAMEDVPAACAPSRSRQSEASGHDVFSDQRPGVNGEHKVLV